MTGTSFLFNPGQCFVKEVRNGHSTWCKISEQNKSTDHD